MIKLCLKLLTTLLLLWLAWHSIDAAEFATVSLARPIWLGAAILITCFMIVTEAITFRAAVSAQGHQVGFSASSLYSLVGWFFSNVAPSSFGADIFRGVQMTRIGMAPASAFGIALAIRLVSFGTLVAVIIIGLPLGLRQTAGEARLLLALVAALAVGGFGVAVACSLLAERTRSFRWPRIVARVLPALGIFADLLRANRSTALCWTSALIHQLLLVVLVWMLSRSLALPISFAQILALVPAALFVAMVPITIGSWGVRELAFVQILGFAGIAPEAALSLSLALGLFRLFVGAIGGLAWMVGTRNGYRIQLSHDVKTSVTATTDTGTIQGCAITRH